MMLVIASSTARVTDLQSAGENPNVSVKRSIAPRTTHSILGSLRSSTFNSRSRLMRRSVPSYSCGRREVIVRDLRRLFGKIVRGSQICSEKSHVAFDIALQQQFPVFVLEHAMNCDGCCAGYRRYLPQPLTSLFEPTHRAVQ